MKTPSYQDVLLDLEEDHALRSVHALRDLVRRYDSPIEQVFVASMVRSGFSETSPYDGSFDAGLVACSAVELEPDFKLVKSRDKRTCTVLRCPSAYVFCATQFTVRLEDRQILPDFAFVPWLPEWRKDGVRLNRVIVELDGHDFHERTPDQAQRDKSRDRQLQSCGWKVLRFTGREVLQSPSSCLLEVLTAVGLGRQSEVA